MSSSSLAKLYLASYNAAQACGWALVLYKLVVESRSLADAYSVAAYLVKILQLTAFLEVQHSVIGLVRSAPLMAFMQWGGRAHVLFAVISQLPGVQQLSYVFMIFASWSVSEIIRYPQYGLSVVGLCPSWLTWLRYTAFIILYPMGVFGEVMVMYLGLRHMKEKNLYHSVFKHLPFRYPAFVTGLLWVYPFLWLYLYRHMLQQRSVKVGKKHPRNKPRRQPIKRATD